MAFTDCKWGLEVWQCYVFIFLFFQSFHNASVKLEISNLICFIHYGKACIVFLPILLNQTDPNDVIKHLFFGCNSLFWPRPSSCCRGYFVLPQNFLKKNLFSWIFWFFNIFGKKFVTRIHLFIFIDFKRKNKTEIFSEQDHFKLIMTFNIHWSKNQRQYPEYKKVFLVRNNNSGSVVFVVVCKHIASLKYCVTYKKFRIHLATTW